jgi:hypothetical protein
MSDFRGRGMKSLDSLIEENLLHYKNLEICLRKEEISNNEL